MRRGYTGLAQLCIVRGIVMLLYLSILMQVVEGVTCSMLSFFLLHLMVIGDRELNSQRTY
jgi:hypothetical protein